MNRETQYDIGIAGGGLAGLTAAIQLRKRSYTVILFEKNKYPFHRVCGEYISNESRNYLIDCGIDIHSMNLPQISKLQVSAPNGKLLKADLDLGGFGISRFTLDNLLYEEAKRLGVVIFENLKADDIWVYNDFYKIPTVNGIYKVKIALGSFGKRSNLDVRWRRDFLSQKPNALNNYIGVKYHIKTNHPEDTIILHNFEGGYCGMSKIEADKYCLCYLTTAANLQQHGSIASMEQNVLIKNPYLKNIFRNSEFLFDKPVSISQISFDKKELVHNNIPLVGDASGMITPLCGNGMSMAMHGSNLLCDAIDNYLQQRISLKEMLALYETKWKENFESRLKVGRLIQKQFGKAWQTNLFISIMKTSPRLTHEIIKKTHGKEF